jgi:hypothetical protein
LNGTHQLFAYGNVVNIVGENINTINKAVLHASKEVDLVNAEKTSYILMSCCQKAGQWHSIKIANS